MSKDLMVAVVLRYHGRPPREKLLACVLAQHAHNDGSNIFPSVDRMAALTNQCVRSVKSQLGEMLRSKWLMPVRWESGPGSFPVYKINPDWIAGVELDALATCSVEKSTLTDERGARRGQKGVQIRAERGANHDNTNKAQGISNRTSGSGEGGLAKVMQIYPKLRVDVANAQRAWARLKPDASLTTEILRAATTMAASSAWSRDEGRYAPKLSKWIREQGWLDPAAAGPQLKAPTVESIEWRPPTAEEIERNRQNAAINLAALRERLNLPAVASKEPSPSP